MIVLEDGLVAEGSTASPAELGGRTVLLMTGSAELGFEGWFGWLCLAQAVHLEDIAIGLPGSEMTVGTHHVTILLPAEILLDDWLGPALLGHEGGSTVPEDVRIAFLVLETGSPSQFPEEGEDPSISQRARMAFLRKKRGLRIISLGMDVEPLSQVRAGVDDPVIPLSSLAFQMNQITEFILIDISNAETANLTDPCSCLGEDGNEGPITGMGGGSK